MDKTGDAHADTDLEGALSRARALLAPRADPELREAVAVSVLLLDPSAAREHERAAAYRANYGNRKARDGRRSGFKRGVPQCPGCRRFIAAPGGWCPGCRTFDGNHDHGR